MLWGYSTAQSTKHALGVNISQMAKKNVLENNEMWEYFDHHYFIYFETVVWGFVVVGVWILEFLKTPYVSHTFLVRINVRIQHVLWLNLHTASSFEPCT